MSLTNAAQTASTTYNALAMVPYRIGSKWGYADTLGKIKVKPTFDSLGFFIPVPGSQQPLALFSEKGQWGLIGPEGVPVIPAQFQAIPEFHFDESGNFMVKKGTFWGLYNANKLEVMAPIYEALDIDFNAKAILAKKNAKYGLFNRQGKAITELIYDTLEPGYDSEWEPIFIGTIGTERFIVNLDGSQNVLLHSDLADESELDAPVVDPGAEQEDLLPALAEKNALDSILPLPEMNGYVFKAYKNKKYGIVKNDGTMPIAPQYEAIEKVVYSDYLKGQFVCIVKKGGYLGIVDQTNRSLLPAAYSEIAKDKASAQENVFITTKEGKRGYFIASTIYPPIPAVYETIHFARSIPVHSGWSFVLLKVKKGGKWGFVGENGVEFFQP